MISALLVTRLIPPDVGSHGAAARVAAGSGILF
jgi:hypothetical protein